MIFDLGKHEMHWNRGYTGGSRSGTGGDIAGIETGGDRAGTEPAQAGSEPAQAGTEPASEGTEPAPSWHQAGTKLAGRVGASHVACQRVPYGVPYDASRMAQSRQLTRPVWRSRAI